MSLDELEVSFAPPPSTTRKREDQIFRDCYMYPIYTGVCVDNDEERQTLESIEIQYAPHDWCPASMGVDGYNDSLTVYR